MKDNLQHYRNFIAHRHLSARAKGWKAWYLMRRGKTTKEAAFALGISPSRVYVLLKEIGKGKKASANL